MLLFEEEPRSAAVRSDAPLPLAARLRPRSLDDYVGQQHLLGPGKLLRRAIEADRFTAILLYGPPGVGKTSLAELIAVLTRSAFDRLSAVSASVKDLRRCIEEAKARRRLHDGLQTILFVDEIHRFNKAQQDALLPDVEHGEIRFVGATTENPFFSVVGPLLSRAQVFRLEALSEAEVADLLRRATNDPRAFPGRRVELSDAAVAFWAQASEGDARRALNALEIAVMTTAAEAGETIRIDLDVAQESMQQKALAYGADGHYDTISAYIKSMRNSEPDAAVYWLATMLEAGEDIRFVARRLCIFAAEDVGNADPRALILATSAMQAVDLVGLPEARIILAQATTYCATAPKSNAAIKAIDRALEDVRAQRVQRVPEAVRDAHYKGAKALGHGVGYEYPHDMPAGVSAMASMPASKRYYEPVNLGYEAKIRQRLEYWAHLREQRRGNGASQEATTARHATPASRNGDAEPASRGE